MKLLQEENLWAACNTNMFFAIIIILATTFFKKSLFSSVQNFLCMQKELHLNKTSIFRKMWIVVYYILEDVKGHKIDYKHNFIISPALEIYKHFWQHKWELAIKKISIYLYVFYAKRISLLLKSRNNILFQKGQKAIPSPICKLYFSFPSIYALPES